jgi:hypothetical protein
LLSAIANQPLESTISLQHATKKTTTMMCVCTESHDELRDVVHQLKKSVEATGQMTMTIKEGKQPSTKADIKNDARDADDSALCVLYISYSADSEPLIAWRLYDVLDGTMIGGKKCLMQNADSAKEQIAHWLWNTLFNYEGPFGSYLAYIAIDESKYHNKYSLRYCWWDGSGDHTVLLSTPHPIVCPVWNASLEAPGIVYSECTPSNVRLMMINLQGQRRTVIDQPGTFAGVSYAPKGEFVAYCRSGDIWKFKFDSKLMKSIHTMLVHEDKPVGCPQITKEGDILYCCKGKIKKYHMLDDWTEILTEDGYCVGPSYSPMQDTVVFSKKIKGFLQLCTLSLTTGKCIQLTTDDGNKTDPVWSPCGTMLAFVHHKQHGTELVILNTLTTKRVLIPTGVSKICCPSWSTYRGLSQDCLNKMT